MAGTRQLLSIAGPWRIAVSDLVSGYPLVEMEMRRNRLLWHLSEAQSLIAADCLAQCGMLKGN